MTKIDRRIAYYMVIDTETANSTDYPLAYDLGLAIIDKRGKVYDSRSFVIADVYCGEKELMKTAYYAEKLPLYEEALKSGERRMVSLFTARNIVKELCEEYRVKAIMAHNTPFDNRALNTTIRYITKSKMRFFLPYGIPLYDTMRMAKDTICKQKNFVRFVDKYGLRTPTGRIPSNANALYKYISKNPDFEEEHQGLADVLIEAQIFAKCMAQHKTMRKMAYGK